MNVIILAGGLGTRLHPITKDKYSKCMIDVNGKPFLYHLLKQILETNSINKFILSVGHKYKQIIDYFGDNFWGVNVEYSIEEKPLGTGGAIKFALETAHYGDKNIPFIVLNGDTFTNINLNKMMEFHERKKADISIAVKFVGNISRFGNVVFDKNKKITYFKEKAKQIPGYINAGVYIINEINKYKLPDKGSFENDFLQKTITNIFAFEDNFDFIDIGIPEEYKEFVRQRIKKDAMQGYI